ncbi:MAG: tyrosine-type recombinase/integrase, partial [Terriglobales bacterium]
MTTSPVSFAPLLERFFTQRLMQQRQASPHTISSYRDTFRMLLKFADQQLHTPPARLVLKAIDAPLIVRFLDHLEKHRKLSARSRNLRLTAIHSFFRYAAFELPDHAAQIQRILAIPTKRFTRTQVHSLTREEIKALPAAPDQHTWFGRRDHAFLMVAAQTGLRQSEMSGLTLNDLTLGPGAHVRVIGKGRKERCVPLAKPTVIVLKTWLRELFRGDGQVLFPNLRGTPLSADAVHYLFQRHVEAASRICPSLKGKRVTVHVLRHTMALDLV